jgi:hypothetical protein
VPYPAIWSKVRGEELRNESMIVHIQNVFDLIHLCSCGYQMQMLNSFFGELGVYGCEIIGKYEERQKYLRKESMYSI